MSHCRDAKALSAVYPVPHPEAINLLRTCLLLMTLLVTACASSPRQHPQASERYALVQTGTTRLAHGIFPVQIYNIDGKEIHTDRQLHQIAPGVHTIAARAQVNRNLIRGVSRDPAGRGSEPLTFNFQSGRRYFLGLKATSPRSADWRLVVWKVEDVNAGALLIDD